MATKEVNKRRAGGIYREESNAVLTHGGPSLCFRNRDSLREDRTDTSYFLHQLTGQSGDQFANLEDKILPLNIHPVR